MGPKLYVVDCLVFLSPVSYAPIPSYVATAHDSTHRRVVLISYPLTVLWPSFVVVESLPCTFRPSNRNLNTAAVCRSLQQTFDGV